MNAVELRGLSTEQLMALAHELQQAIAADDASLIGEETEQLAAVASEVERRGLQLDLFELPKWREWGAT